MDLTADVKEDLLNATVALIAAAGEALPRRCVASISPDGRAVAHPEIYADPTQAAAAAARRVCDEPHATHFVASATHRQICVWDLTGSVVVAVTRTGEAIVATPSRYYHYWIGAVAPRPGQYVRVDGVVYLVDTATASSGGTPERRKLTLLTLKPGEDPPESDIIDELDGSA